MTEKGLVLIGVVIFPVSGNICSRQLFPDFDGIDYYGCYRREKRCDWGNGPESVEAKLAEGRDQEQGEKECIAKRKYGRFPVFADGRCK